MAALLLLAGCATTSSSSGPPLPPCGAPEVSACAAPGKGPRAVVAGTVVSASGEPVEGALVAINPGDPNAPGAMRAVQVAALRTGPGGVFRAELPAQPVVLTATFPGAIPALLLDQRAPAGSTLRVTLRLGGPGRTVTGRCRSRMGVPLTGLSVRLARTSDDIGDVFLPQVEGERFTLTIDPAWQVTAYADATDHQLAIQGVPPEAEAAITLKGLGHDDRPPPPEAMAWIKANALPLVSAEAGHGFEDLRPVGALIGDARVVALGEATHGSAQFFQLKHRMLEYLVSEKGFTRFGIEASWPDTLAANRYALGGPGDPYQAVARMGFWTWDTEEVVALLKWMRAWNATPGHQPVQFIGFDMQTPAPAARALLRYLDQVAPELVPPTAAGLQLVWNELADPAAITPDQQEALAAQGAALLQQFDQHREAWVKRSSAAAFAEARQMLVILQQAGSVYRAGAPFMARDQAMAANVLWMLEQAPRGTRAVLWAHNGHVVARSPATTMGGFLRTSLGKDYLAVGLGFGQGGLQAVQLPISEQSTLRDFTTPAPLPGSLDGALAAAGLPLLALDLRSLPRTGPAGDWFSRGHAMKSIGAAYADDALRSGVLSETPDLPGDYDLLLFVAQTTAARASPGARDLKAARPPALPRPTNLDLAEGTASGVPAGWTLTPRSARAGWRASPGTGAECGASPEAPGRCVVLRRDLGASFLDAPGLLQQRIEAAGLAGKTLTLKGRAQLEPSDRADGARLELTCSRKAQAQPAVARAAVPDTRRWTSLELPLQVPSDATTCTYGLAAGGAGTVRMGPLQLIEGPATAH